MKVASPDLKQEKMTPVHVAYSVEIKKVKYITEEGVKFPATALVKFQMDGKEKPWV
jgi:hypothetical protein